MRVLLVVLILCVSLPSLLLFLRMKQKILSQSLNTVETISIELARSIALAERIVDFSTRNYLERMIVSTPVRELNRKVCSEMFESQIRVTRMYKDILLINTQTGEVLASGTSSPSPKLENSFLKQLASADDNEITLFGTFALSPDTFVFPYAAMFRTSNGVPHALIALVDASFFDQAVRTIYIPDRWTITMSDKDNRLFFRYPSRIPEGERRRGETIYQGISQALAQRTEDQGVIRTQTASGRGMIMGYVRQRSAFDQPFHMLLTAAYPEAEALREAREASTLSILLSLCFTGLAALAAYQLGTRYLAHPLEKFLKATRCFAEGELNARSHIDYKAGELGMLAQAFDDMADVLQQKDARQRATEAQLTLYTTKLEELVKQRTDDLTQTQRHIQLILDSTSEGIVELDPQNRVAFYNKAARRILGYDGGSLLGKNFLSLLPSSEGENNLQNAVEGKNYERFPGLELQRIDEETVTVDLFVAPIVRDGERVGTVLTFIDLSNVLEQHQMMDAIYETTSNGYLTISDELQLLDCNPAMMEMLGISDKKQLLEDFFRFSPTYQSDGLGSRDKYIFAVHEALEKESTQYEWNFLDIEKNLVPCTITLKRLYVNRRRLVVGNVQDMRDQYKAQEALALQREQLQNILDSTPIILAIVANDIVCTVNRNGTALLGLRTGDKLDSLYLNAEDQQAVIDLMNQREIVDNHPLKLKSADGRVFDTLLSLRPFYHERRKAFMIWVVDVSELENARREAEDAARVKSDFLASMSHEIRTPMNAILGMSHLCLQTHLTEKQNNYVKKIQTAAMALLSLINDILDFSKIEAGKLQLEVAPFRLSESLQSLWDLVAFRAEAKGIHFSMDIAQDVPDWIHGDSLRLNQILLNLCDNALKFTEKGSVVLNVHSEQYTGENGERLARIFFGVTDTGIGMQPEQAARIFTPFIQSDRSIARKYGGTGLGLAICKHLVESMNGGISVTSVYGKGTTMTFSIEARIGDSNCGTVIEGRNLPANASRKPQFRAKADILLVEDNAVNQEIAVELLEQCGVKVDIANNGLEALRALEKKRYDLIFMDVQMPLMDGLEATRRIRLLPDCSADVLPIVAMTAHAMKGDQEKSLAAGMNAHITKPIDPYQLYRILFESLKPDTITLLATEENSGEWIGDESEILPVSIPGLSVESGLYHVQGNAELYRSLLRKFPIQYGNTLPRLQEWLASGQFEEAQRLVHTLKGLCGTLGMSDLAETAARLETVLKTGVPYEGPLFLFSSRLHAMTDALDKVFSQLPKESGSTDMPSAEKLTELKRIVTSLPHLMKVDLMKAWEEVTGLGSILSDTVLADQYTALADAVRDCDETKVEQLGQELLRSLNPKD